MGETIQILELFGGIGSPRCALRNLNIPTKAIEKVQTRGAEHVPPSCGRQYISLRTWANGDLVM